MLTQGASEGYAAASTSIWYLAAVDGTSPPPSTSLSGTALGVNADIEHDDDGDMLGDETQDPDDDNDGIADAADNCPTTAGADQVDADGDGAGDLCDGDGTPDGRDRCLLHAGPGGCPSAAILALMTPRRLTRRAFAGGVRFTVTPDQPVALRVLLVAPGRGKGTILAEKSLPFANGPRSVRLKPSRGAAAGIRRAQLRVLAINIAGAQTNLRRTIRIRR